VPATHHDRLMAEALVAERHGFEAGRDAAVRLCEEVLRPLSNGGARNAVRLCTERIRALTPTDGKERAG